MCAICEGELVGQTSAPAQSSAAVEVANSLPPLGTLDEIAYQMTHDFWGDGSHRFDVTQGGTITVNLTAITDSGRQVARQALALWSDIIGVTFQEVSGDSQIKFDDLQIGTGAFSESEWTNGITNWATVNVSLQRLNLHTYIHEIGHALGLGHTANANSGTAAATYPNDALWRNDGDAVSTMSYFDNGENTYYAGLGFSHIPVVTPQVADILAVGNLYGLSTTTRTGDTTYGFNNNSGRSLFDATLHPNVSYTVFDSGGIDTLDYSGFSANQLIDLNPEAFSNVGASVGNVVIARGTTIENARGGSGADRIVGNGADNGLSGNGGDDQLYGHAGNDVLDGGAGGDLLSGGAGNDVLIGGAGSDDLDGSGGSDVYVVASAAEHGTAEIADAGTSGSDELRFAATGSAQTLTLFAGDTGLERIVIGTGTGASAVRSGTLAHGVDARALGNGIEILGNNGVNILMATIHDDMILGAGGNDLLYGYQGDDILDGGLGLDRMYGGAGDDLYIVSDAADYAYERAGEGLDSVRASISHALRDNVENLTLTGAAGLAGTGNEIANVIVGNVANNRLNGLAGDDRLHGGGGNDTLDGGAGVDRLYGGTGNDLYIVHDATDYIYENAGEGTDRVISSVSHILRANIEQLSLTGTANLYGRGNADANIISGNSGANRLNGFEGADRLYGGAGNDVLDGGTGDDQMRGDAGNDVYYVDSSRDVVVEALNGGTDTVYASATLTLRANVERLTLTGTDVIKGTGNELANIMSGNAGANTLSGMAGNDRLFGNDGADVLIGGDGNDLLDGGSARDRLTGGSGADRFVFDDGDFGGTTASGADQVSDFSRVERDRIDLRGVDADGALAGDQAFAWLGSAAFSGTAGELRYQQAGGHTYIEGDINGDGIVDFLIRLDGLHSLGTGDFVL